MIRPQRITAVARNTFREAVRNRAFVGLVLFAVAFILFSLLLGELTLVGQGVRVVTDFGYFAVSLFGATTAIVMGALLVYKEVEKKTIYTIVSKPIRRSEFLLGKYMGLVTILTLQVVLLSLLWTGVLAIQGGEVTGEHLKGMLLVLFEVALVAAMATMFSAASTPVLTGLFSLGAFMVGRVVYLLQEMMASGKGWFAENPLGRAVGEMAVTIFPDLSVFNVSQQVLLQVPVTWEYIAKSMAYGAAWGSLFLVIGLFAFERRDFT